MSEQLQRKMSVGKDRFIMAVVGEKGGIHYWVAPSDRDRLAGGVEQHRRCESTDTATNDHCWLLGGPCEHDGSSLYADEVYTPLFKRCNESSDFEPLWLKLEAEYASRFADAE